MFKVVYITPNNWKQSKCPSVGEWTGKLWYTYIMECNWVIKMDDMTDLCNKVGEVYMLYVNEGNHIQKAEYILMIPFIWHSRENRRKRLREQGGAGYKGPGGSLRNRSVLYVDCVVVTWLCSFIKTHRKCGFNFLDVSPSAEGCMCWREHELNSLERKINELDTGQYSPGLWDMGIHVELLIS